MNNQLLHLQSLVTSSHESFLSIARDGAGLVCVEWKNCPSMRLMKRVRGVCPIASLYEFDRLLDVRAEFDVITRSGVLDTRFVPMQEALSEGGVVYLQTLANSIIQCKAVSRLLHPCEHPRYGVDTLFVLVREGRSTQLVEALQLAFRANPECKQLA